MSFVNIMAALEIGQQLTENLIRLLSALGNAAKEGRDLTAEEKDVILEAQKRAHNRLQELIDAMPKEKIQESR